MQKTGVKDTRQSWWNRAAAHPAILSFGVAALAMLLSVALMEPHFYSNDDWFISNLLSGDAGGAPTPYVTYINWLLAAGLSGLYTLAPGLAVNWFTLYQYAVLYAAFAAVLYVLMRWSDSPLRMPAAAIFVLTAVPYFTTDLSYNRTTAIGAFAGMLLLCFWVRQKGKKRYMVAAGLLCLAAAALRFECFLMMLPYNGAVVLAVLWQQGVGAAGGVKAVGVSKAGVKALWGQAKGYVLAFGALFAAAALLYVANAAAYAAWGSGFPAFSKQRERFVDYPTHEYAAVAGPLEEAGVTPNDYELLSRWVFADGEFFTTQKLAEINALQPAPAFSTGLWRMAQGYGEFVLTPMYLVCLCVGAGVLLLAAGGKKSGWAAALTLYLFAAFHIIMLCFMVLGRMTRAVAECGCFAVLGALLVCLAALPAPPFGKTRAAAGALALCLLCTLPAHERYSYLGHSYRQDEGLAFYQTLAARQDTLYFTYIRQGATPAPYRACGVFARPPAGLFDNIVYLGGWFIGHPAIGQQYSRLGIEAPLRELDRPDARVLAVPDSVPLLTEYMACHTGKRVSATVVEVLNGYRVYRFTGDVGAGAAQDPALAIQEAGAALPQGCEALKGQQLNALSVKVAGGARPWQGSGSLFVEISGAEETESRVYACYEGAAHPDGEWAFALTMDALPTADADAQNTKIRLLYAPAGQGASGRYTRVTASPWYALADLLQGGYPEG